ncbi:hypothetical protein GUJ93_ZPchr0003g17089 [Zizania palustris]|uniref:H15 domain-containing protein n=1 Tax=Zizania palustris TaxID=103762 RepID=A0A8J5SJV4_ZIZPA|nr:hypothetical protein GUJ93_ZPchr0003g17089 [Zizania palustris]
MTPVRPPEGVCRSAFRHRLIAHELLPDKHDDYHRFAPIFHRTSTASHCPMIPFSANSSPFPKGCSCGQICTHLHRSTEEDPKPGNLPPYPEVRGALASPCCSCFPSASIRCVFGGFVGCFFFLRRAAASELSACSSFLSPPLQMILVAIDALDDKNGSNKTVISQYIQETYQDLSSEHPSLLTEHLASMKQTDEIILSKNNYFRSPLFKGLASSVPRRPSPLPTVPCLSARRRTSKEVVAELLVVVAAAYRYHGHCARRTEGYKR